MELQLTTEMKDDLFLRACCHEAGHAVVAHALGARVMGLGASSLDGAYCEIDVERPSRDHALIVLAGERATYIWDSKTRKHNERAFWTGEERLTIIPGISDLPGVKGGLLDMSINDVAGVRAYLRANYFSGPEAEKEVRRLKSEAFQLVDQLWRAIVALVEALNEAADWSAEELEAELDEEQVQGLLAKVEA